MGRTLDGPERFGFQSLLKHDAYETVSLSLNSATEYCENKMQLPGEPCSEIPGGISG